MIQYKISDPHFLVTPLSSHEITFCKDIEFKANDKLYISKYSSIPSILFNKLKFDLI